MSKVERLGELVKTLEPKGFPYCDVDADKVIKKIKDVVSHNLGSTKN